MSDYELKVTEQVMAIKSKLQTGVVTYEEVESILALFLGQVRWNTVLSKQLDYALETGGELLPEGNIVEVN